jgi:hypothetical protein
LFNNYYMGGKILKGRGRPDTDGLDAQSATNWIRTYGEVWSIRSAEFRIREKIAALTSGEVTTEDREAVETRLSSDKMLLARLIEDASGETGLYWEIPSNLVQMLSEDPSKLWENATLDQFRENGKIQPDEPERWWNTFPYHHQTWCSREHKTSYMRRTWRCNSNKICQRNSWLYSWE